MKACATLLLALMLSPCTAPFQTFTIGGHLDVHPAPTVTAEMHRDEGDLDDAVLLPRPRLDRASVLANAQSAVNVSRASVAAVAVRAASRPQNTWLRHPVAARVLRL